MARIEPPVLTTERLIMRGIDMRDWPAYRDLMTSERSTHLGGPKPEAQVYRDFAFEIAMWDLRGFGFWAVCEKENEDESLGIIGLWQPLDWPEPEIGWILWSDATEGRGIAREAALAARDYAFHTLGWETVVSYIAPGNGRSLALAERLGAVHDPSAASGEPGWLVYRHQAGELEASA